MAKLFMPIAVALGLPVHACRFEPTCSHYCEDAIKQYGITKGATLCLKRIIRCRPGVPAGFDPVPKE
jgi:putative membrane protein insertion efficiency factor